MKMKLTVKIAIISIPIGLILLPDFFSGYAIQISSGQDIFDPDYSIIPSDFQQNSLGYKFIGAGKCASTCHNTDSLGFQYTKWKTSLHADAFNVLTSKRAQKYADRNHIKTNPGEYEGCLKCHVTGSGLDTSYFSPTYKKQDGITCEACHKKISDGSTYLPVEDDCLECHNNSMHKVNKFNFTEKSKIIEHNRPSVMSSIITP
jgi:hypothetical protein